MLVSAVPKNFYQKHTTLEVVLLETTIRETKRVVQSTIFWRGCQIFRFYGDDYSI